MLMKTEVTEKVSFHLLSSTAIDLTPDVVAEFRGIESSAVERAISRQRVKHLREMFGGDLSEHRTGMLTVATQGFTAEVGSDPVERHTEPGINSRRD